MRIAQRGFTLIELMMTLAILAILAIIAIPGYRGYILRAQRTDARVALLRLQANEEKFFLQNNIYTDAFPALGMTDTSERGLYRTVIRLTAAGMGYTATTAAVPGLGQENDPQCASYSIDQAGTTGATGSVANPSQYCWR